MLLLIYMLFLAIDHGNGISEIIVLTPPISRFWIGDAEATMAVTTVARIDNFILSKKFEFCV